MYALGACLYTFVFGRIPFNAASVFKLFQVVQHEPLRFPSQPQVSHDLKDLLLRMLAKVGFSTYLTAYCHNPTCLTTLCLYASRHCLGHWQCVQCSLTAACVRMHVDVLLRKAEDCMLSHLPATDSGRCHTWM